MFWQATYTTARRVVIAVIGVTVMLLGVILIFTPGPAVVVIPLGLAILATEFVWARRLLNRVRDDARGAFAAFRGGSKKRKQHPATKKARDASADLDDAGSLSSS